MELESLVVPAADAEEEAGKLLLNLKQLWARVNPEERRKLLQSILDGVYVDAKNPRSIAAIRPKAPFRPVFQVAAARAGSDIRILNELLNSSGMFLVEAGES